MNEILMRAIVDCIAFVELSGDEVIDPDAAVNLLESLASMLKDLSLTDRKTFARCVAKMEVEERAYGKNKRTDFLASFIEDFGLNDGF